MRRTGLFTATAPLPRRKIRATNKARYIARIGKEKSFKLKLVRRMLVSSTRVRARKVTITGRVVLPLAAPVRQVVVKRRVSCGRYRVIKRFTPPASGRFRVTLGRAAEPPGRRLPAPDAGPQVHQQPEDLPHVHAPEVRRPRASGG